MSNGHAQEDLGTTTQSWITRLLAAEEQSRDSAFDVAKLRQLASSLDEREGANNRRTAGRKEGMMVIITNQQKPLERFKSKLGKGGPDLNQRFETYDRVLFDLDNRSRKIKVTAKKLESVCQT